MGYSVEFAGIHLEDYCKVLNVKRSVLPERENFSKSIPSVNGSIYTGHRYKERTIKLEIGIVAISEEDYIEKIRKLAGVLDTKNPCKLIISDEPSKYCYAILDGSTDLTKKFKTGTLEISFLCHDPVLYSDSWKSFTPDANNIITFENEGTIETSPIVDVDFRNKACFFQCTNNKGETVLIGEPKDSTKPSVPLTDVVVDDNCESGGTFTTLASSLLDSERETKGNFGVGFNGEGIVCTNYGGTEENKWNGVGFKKSLDQNVDEFEVVIDIVFSSQGKNYEVPKPPPPKPPSKDNPNPQPSVLGTYKVVNCGGLWINKEANTKHPMHAMSPGELIYPTEIKGKWYKHTKKYKFGTYTGWSYGRYLKKVSNSKKRTNAHTFNATSTEEEKFAEDELGILEVYGFDQNGSKLFKMEVSDTNEYYENVIPKIMVGNTTILQEKKNCPSPRKIQVKDNNGKTSSKEVASGVFGQWNDLEGKLIIRREKSLSGEYVWSASVYKYKNGKIINTMVTQNSINNSSFSKSALNYLGFYIGSYGKNRPVDLVTITNVKVRRLNMKTGKLSENNLEIFKPGDHLQIDFETGLVTLNDIVELTTIDIGSEFFDVAAGTSQIAVRSDDKEAIVVAGIQEKFR